METFFLWWWRHLLGRDSPGSGDDDIRVAVATTNSSRGESLRAVVVGDAITRQVVCACVRVCVCVSTSTQVSAPDTCIVNSCFPSANVVLQCIIQQCLRGVDDSRASSDQPMSGVTSDNATSVTQCVTFDLVLRLT